MDFEKMTTEEIMAVLDQLVAKETEISKELRRLEAAGDANDATIRGIFYEIAKRLSVKVAQ